MRVGIVDADLISRGKHRFPNLACMKLSSYYKRNGNDVELVLDYKDINSEKFDKVFVSKVFTDTAFPEELLSNPILEYGGTGFFYDKSPKLPDEIEHIKPDYDLYRDWANSRIVGGDPKDQFKYYLNSSIGFTTRGCFRQCSFCVNQNSTKVLLHSPLSEFVDDRNHYICLLDDNILGYSGFRSIWQQLEETGKNFEYKQGMDFRLLNKEKMELIANSKGYNTRSLIFAFDNIQDKQSIIEKLEIWRSVTDQFTRFYVLTGFDRNNKYDLDFWKQDLYDVFERIKILMEYGCLPYLMRYSKWVESPFRGTYSNLNRWCNYPRFFKKLSYREMQNAIVVWSKNENCSELRHLKLVEKEIPELAKEYFDIKWTEIKRYIVK